MRIAIVTLGIWPDDPIGGVQIHCYHEKQEMETLGHQVTVFRRDGSTISFVFKTIWKLWGGRFDIVHVHYPTYPLLPVLASPGKVVLTFHGSDYMRHARHNPFWRVVVGLGIRRAKAITAPSKALAESLHGKYIPNGV
jgi:Glycosyltransferase Family 4